MRTLMGAVAMSCGLELNHAASGLASVPTPDSAVAPPSGGPAAGRAYALIPSNATPSRRICVPASAGVRYMVVGWSSRRTQPSGTVNPRRGANAVVAAGPDGSRRPGGVGCSDGDAVGDRMSDGGSEATVGSATGDPRERVPAVRATMTTARAATAMNADVGATRCNDTRTPSSAPEFDLPGRHPKFEPPAERRASVEHLREPCVPSPGGRSM